MQLVRIDGNVTSSHAHPSLKGCLLLICQPLGFDGKDLGEPVLAIGGHGAGLHSQVVMLADGSTAQAMVADKLSPLRNVVLGVVDELPKEASA